MLNKENQAKEILELAIAKKALELIKEQCE